MRWSERACAPLSFAMLMTFIREREKALLIHFMLVRKKSGCAAG
jgi:hypothetical protein